MLSLCNQLKRLEEKIEPLSEVTKECGEQMIPGIFFGVNHPDRAISSLLCPPATAKELLKYSKNKKIKKDLRLRFKYILSEVSRYANLKSKLHKLEMDLRRRFKYISMEVSRYANLKSELQNLEMDHRDTYAQWERARKERGDIREKKRQRKLAKLAKKRLKKKQKEFRKKERLIKFERLLYEQNKQGNKVEGGGPAFFLKD